MASFVRKQFLVQVCAGRDPQLCITLPVGVSFAARRAAHLDRLPGEFSVV